MRDTVQANLDRLGIKFTKVPLHETRAHKKKNVDGYLELLKASDEVEQLKKEMSDYKQDFQTTKE